MDEEMTNNTTVSWEADKLPFPFHQQSFCRYEPIEKRIDRVRVLVVDNLLHNEDDVSDVARKDWKTNLNTQIQKERKIASLALENILNNISRLVKEPETSVAHLSEIEEATKDFHPQAIVLSGTLSDFDYYNPNLLDNFKTFILSTHVPVLAICGGHQLVGLSFGARVVTLDNYEPHEQRENRPCEYQYRYIRIIKLDDQIFRGIYDKQSGIWQDHTTIAHTLHVWQNHGLQLDAVPDGFQLLATSYRCHNQMMVRRTNNQLIYTVQFHLEKSFEDWNKNPTRWEHPNQSRDGRIIFENFLIAAIDNASK
jgi:GMP synthase (glutamine-hydrolysing)